MGYSLWFTKGSDMTEHALTMHTHVHTSVCSYVPQEGLEMRFLTLILPDCVNA